MLYTYIYIYIYTCLMCSSSSGHLSSARRLRGRPWAHGAAWEFLIHIHVYTYIYIYTYILFHTYTFKYIYIYTHICIDDICIEREREKRDTCERVCVYIYIYIYMCVWAHGAAWEFLVYLSVEIRFWASSMFFFLAVLLCFSFGTFSETRSRRHTHPESELELKAGTVQNQMFAQANRGEQPGRF